MLTSNQMDILTGVIMLRNTILLGVQDRTIDSFIQEYERLRHAISVVCERLGKEQEDETSSD